jgi:hypothetical protein
MSNLSDAYPVSALYVSFITGLGLTLPSPASSPGGYLLPFTTAAGAFCILDSPGPIRPYSR